ncbi:MAG TPA: EipA family protein, partial [Gammaproteobacteria bacterium]|nr:EipA family protein [Gammaproteobacteria bacterium]
RGTLYFKDGTSTAVYWRGPSLGIDFGGNASKAFILIYHLPNIHAVFQRFGGVEGSLYYVGGVGVTYNRSGNILLAPVRFGVGWRQGINVGYLHLSPNRSWIPF